MTRLRSKTAGVAARAVVVAPSLILLVGWALAGSAAAAEGWVVGQVSYPEGLSPAGQALAAQAHGLEPDRRVTRQDLDQALRRLFATGRFAEAIALKVYPGSGGRSRIHCQLSELPAIEAVDVWGAPAGPRARAAELTKALEGRGLDEDRLRFLKRRLQALYSQGGYPFAQITMQIERGFESPTSKLLGFRLDPGPDTRFAAATLVGQCDLSADRLARAAGLAQKPYRAGDIEAARGRLTQLLRSEGYLDARVILRDLYWTPSKREVRVEFGILAGEPYRLAAVRFDEVPTGWDRSHLLAATGLQNGERLTAARLAEARRAVDALLKTRNLPVQPGVRLACASLFENTCDVYFQLRSTDQ